MRLAEDNLNKGDIYMPNFNGQLNSNEIFAALFNMIISQQVFADNIKGTNAKLVNAAKVDGSLYGDTKLYYSTDVLKSRPWLNDAEATNLLAVNRPKAPECQAIKLDVFRQIDITIDNYLSKRAWSTEGAFSSFNDVILGWISVTKKIYESTLYNTYIGTATGSANTSLIEIPLSDITETGEEANRLRAQQIAKTLADLFVEMEDVSRDFNDYKQLRSYSTDEIKVVWNAMYANEITKLDLPTIYHKDGVVEKLSEYQLPAKYFGNMNTTAGTTASSNTTIRAAVEKDFGTGSAQVHLFPGQLLPNSCAYNANETYTQDASVVCKIYTKLPPFMSAFEVGTSFFNPRSLTENHYFTFGHNTIEYLKAFPLITIKEN